MCVRSRVSLTPGPGKSWRNLRGVKRARRFPLPTCLREEATSFTKVNWWRCQQHQRSLPTKSPAKSYKLSWNFGDLKNITKNMPKISSLESQQSKLELFSSIFSSRKCHLHYQNFFFLNKTCIISLWFKKPLETVRLSHYVISFMIKLALIKYIVWIELYK